MNFYNVKEVIVNWSNTEADGETYLRFQVGEKHITQILYHEPKGEGDKHFVDVIDKDENKTRYFNLDMVSFYKEGESL